MLPQRLKPGDTLGIVSPSMPVLPEQEEQLAAGISHLHSLGFKLVLGDHVGTQTLGYSATPQEKASDINRMFADPNIAGIIGSQGGVNANGCLPYLDLDVIRANPKVFIGISDITVLLAGIYQKTGLVTYHGNDVLWGFGRNPTSYDDTEFINRLVHAKIGLVPANAPRKTVRSGQACGTLIGGNLPCLLKLAGTPYFPNLTGAVLFLEVLKTSPARCDHMFHQMKQIGVFDIISGVIIGYVDGLQSATDPGIQMEDVLLNVAGDFSFPILKINDFGHNCPNTVLPIGTQAELDADMQTLTLAQPCIL